MVRTYFHGKTSLKETRYNHCYVMEVGESAYLVYLLAPRGKWRVSYIWANGDVDYWDFKTLKAARQWLLTEGA